MSLKTFKPYTKSTRGTILVDRTGLWKGKPFSYKGKHFNINTEVTFKPTPIQKPRIPIWIGGMWPNKKPFIRASKWDGVFPISKSEKPVSPKELREVKNYIYRESPNKQQYDTCNSLPMYAIIVSLINSMYNVMWFSRDLCLSKNRFCRC